MPGTFHVTGKIIPSNTGRSYKVYTITETGERVFIGLVSRSALSALFQKKIFQADLCKFSSATPQKPKELEPKPC
jgi:hypothetical protein